MEPVWSSRPICKERRISPKNCYMKSSYYHPYGIQTWWCFLEHAWSRKKLFGASVSICRKGIWSAILWRCRWNFTRLIWAGEKQSFKKRHFLKIIIFLRPQKSLIPCILQVIPTIYDLQMLWILGKPETQLGCYDLFGACKVQHEWDNWHPNLLQMVQWSSSVARALAFLHKVPILHRDLQLGSQAN